MNTPQDHENPLLIYAGTSAPAKSAMFTRRVLPQPTLTEAEQAELRASSQDALSAFRAKLAERKP
jgi:hypothetical protein